MEDELHYPPGAEPEKPAEAPAPESDKAPEAEPKPEAEEKPEGKEEPPEAKEPKDEAKTEPEPQIKKPRSIYDDLKDTRKDKKDAEARATAAEARAAELEGLLAAKDEAETPAEKREAAKDIKEYAEKHGLDADGVEELANIIASKIPKAESPLTPEEAQQWRTERAKAARDSEDRAILDAAPSVKTELAISDDAELQNVMKEVVRLAHTPEFHDKEVDYIIWKNRDALSKLVSPKKPSFEQGGQRGDAQPEAEPDFSTGKVTPEMAGRVATKSNGGYDITHPR